VKKPLLCLLRMHKWRTEHNEEGQPYQICERCGAYHERFSFIDYSPPG
jgi:hypothetical protein